MSWITMMRLSKYTIVIFMLSHLIIVCSCTQCSDKNLPGDLSECEGYLHFATNKSVETITSNQSITDFESFIPILKELIFSGITYSNCLFTNHVDMETKEAIDNTFLKADNNFAMEKFLEKYKQPNFEYPTNEYYDQDISQNLIEDEKYYYTYEDNPDAPSINKPDNLEEKQSESFEFIEPMVFDLVRGLGSKVGESEVNYLMIIPLNGDPVLFSPEYEVVYKYHQGFEVELPTEHAELDAIKIAHQSTFIDERDHKNGVQFYAEIFQHKPSINFLMVHIEALRVGPEESIMMIAGVTGDVELEGLYELLKPNHEKVEIGEIQTKITNAGIVLNNSFFKTLSKSLVVGLEVLFYYDVMMKTSSITFYPQILVYMTRTFKVQLGLGLYFEADKFVPQFAYRVINESL